MVEGQGITGIESIMFLGPAIDASIETWQTFLIWDLERRDDGTVVAVHPDREYLGRREDYETAYRSKVEWTLPNFTTAAQEAHRAMVADYDGRTGKNHRFIDDDDFPHLVTDAARLHDFHVETGNVNHPAGPPKPPPPACGLAGPDYINSFGLLRDCAILLEARDGLRGTAALNWSVDAAIGSWDGVTVAGIPQQVTKLELVNKSLTGNIPTVLGRFWNLAHLDLSDNALTGTIPVELGLLRNLQELRLSGNSLTGCIPAGLRDVPQHDLDRLGLPDCG